MARVNYVELEKADEETKKAYENQLEKTGYVTNMKKTLLNSLTAYNALMEWYPLRDEVLKFIGERGVIIFCHSISSENACLICSAYFRREFADIGIELEDIEFSEEEIVLQKFGRKMVKEPNNIDDELFESLRKFYTEKEIVILTAFGSLMIATNLINNVLKIPLDENLTGYIKEGGF